MTLLRSSLRNSGAMLMEFVWQRARALAAIALLLTGAGTVIAVARPHAVTDAGLGAEWQCSRTLFVVSCSHSAR